MKRREEAEELKRSEAAEAERRSKIVTFSQQRAIDVALDARDAREESAPLPATEEEKAQLERIR